MVWVHVKAEHVRILFQELYQNTSRRQTKCWECSQVDFPIKPIPMDGAVGQNFNYEDISKSRRSSSMTT